MLINSPVRNRELVLLLLALSVSALASFALSASTTLPGPRGSHPLVPWCELVVVTLLAHAVVRWQAPLADPLILPIVTCLSGLGLVMVERLDQQALAEAYGAAAHHLPRSDARVQIVWIGLGVLLLTALLVGCHDHMALARYPYLTAVAGLVLLLLPAAPLIGTTINGARLWLRLGPFTVQPAEFAKIVLVIFFSAYLAGHHGVLSLAGRKVMGLNLPRARDVGPLLFAWAGSLAVLTVEHDLGLSALFFGVFVVLLYISTERWEWVLVAALLAVLGLALSYLFVHNVHNRIDVWRHPTRDPQGANYQPLQAKYGLGTGGVFGTGIGQGSPGLVPFAKTDFMVSSLGEELGLVGLMAVVLCYALLVERGFRAALACRDDFGKLLAGGLSFVLGLQVFFIIGGVSGLIPLTGVTLPWMSYGGSSVLSNWVLIALVLRVSDTAARASPRGVDAQRAHQALAQAETTIIRVRRPSPH